MLTLLAFSCSFYRTCHSFQYEVSPPAERWSSTEQLLSNFILASSADFLYRPAVIYQSVLSEKRGGSLRWERGPWFVHLNSSSVLLFNSIAVQILLECHFNGDGSYRNCLWCSEKGNKTHQLSFESWFPWVNNKNGETLTHKPVSCPPWMFIEFYLKRTEGKPAAGTYEIFSGSVPYVKPPPLRSPGCHSCSSETGFGIWRAACGFFRLVSGEAVSCVQFDLPLIARASKAS